MELFYEIVLLSCSMELFYGVVLWSCSMELFYGVVLLELFHGVVLLFRIFHCSTKNVGLCKAHVN